MFTFTIIIIITASMNGRKEAGCPGGSPSVPSDSVSPPVAKPQGSRKALIWGDGLWQVEGEQLVKTTLADSWIKFGDATWTDYAFSTEVMLVQSTGHIGLYFRGIYFYTAGLRGVERDPRSIYLDRPRFRAIGRPAQGSQGGCLRLGGGIR